MQNIDKLYKEWLDLQPLKSEYQSELDKKLMLEFNYNSNHIEGNTLTYGQTELLLLFDKVSENSKMKDLEEMKAHNVALKMVREEAADVERPLTEMFIRKVHQTLLREDYTKYKTLPDGQVSSYVIHAGIYKTRPNSVITVTGERFEYASPEETPALMTDLVAWYNNEAEKGELHPIELATIFHYRYIRIHPFEDGNGRIARLLVNYILFRNNYPMIIVKSKDKDNYLTALNLCDILIGSTPSVGAHAELEKLQAFLDYMKKCMEETLNLCIKAAKGESLEEEDDFKKRIAIIKKNSSKQKIEKSSQSVSVCRNAFFALCKYMDTKLVDLKTMFDSVTITDERPQLIQKDTSLTDIIYLKPAKKEYTKPKLYPSVQQVLNHKLVPSDYFVLTHDEMIFSFNHCTYAGENAFSKELSLKICYLSDACSLSSNIVEEKLELTYSESAISEQGKIYVDMLCNTLLDEIVKEIG